VTPFQEIPTPPGLKGPICFRRAALGYPHIQAPDRISGAYALGHVHALDRPIQVHLAMLAAQGRLMEFLGDEPLTRAIDRVTRFFNFRGDAERQAAALSPQSLQLVDAYCRGFNEVAQRRRPLLLRLLGVPRATLSANSTIMMYRLLAYFGLTSMQHTAETVITEFVARGVGRPVFEFLLGDAATGFDLESLRGLQFPEEMSLLRVPHTAGSNAFAVSGRRSATGSALLMGEFHMQSGRFPPVLYAAHLEYADGSYYQGVGVPGLPFLAAGRTPHVGWSYTYGHADNVDFLIEECRDGRCRASNDWLPLTKRVEEVRVRGRKTPLSWTHYESEYGTTTADVTRDGLHPFIRWAGLRETASDLNSVLGEAFPNSAEATAERHRSAKSLSLGAVIADSSGRIAYVQTGRIDARPADWTGAYPRRGSGEPSRTPAALSEEARPFVVDPDEGFVVSANEFNRGRQGQWWSTLPEPIYRWQRLREVLRDSPKPDLNTLVGASYDPVDVCARRLMAVWKPLLPPDQRATELAAWAENQTAVPRGEGRRLMGLFHALHHEVVLTVLEHWMPADLMSELVDAAAGILLFQYHIDGALALERSGLLDQPLLREALATAWPRAQERADSPGWRIPLKFSFVNDYFRGKLPRPFGFDTETVEPPGGPTVPFQCREVAFAGMNLYFAPAFHMVLDMSRPGAWFHLPGGASERRFGPGYGAGVREWLTGKFFPLGDAAGEPPVLKTPLP
jgi:penicillin amidase